MTKNVMDLDGVDAVYSVEYDMFYIGGKYSTDAAEAIDNKEVLTSRYKNLFNSHKTLFVNLIEDEDFNALVSIPSLIDLKSEAHLKYSLTGRKALNVFLEFRSLPISILVSYGMNCALSSDSFPFELNYLMYGCVILAVFLIIKHLLLIPFLFRI